MFHICYTQPRKSLLVRSRMSIYHFSDYRFDAPNRVLVGPSGSVRLRRKVAGVLSFLLAHRQRAVTKDELLDALWEHGEFRENSLSQCIRELRKALDDSAQQPVYIQTVHRKGYQWIFTSVEEGAAECPSAVSVPRHSRSPESPVGEVKSHSTVASVYWAALLLLVSVALLFRYGDDSQKVIADSKVAPRILTVAVLPFINRTHSPKLQWLELGLSDMFSNTLQRVVGLQLIPAQDVQSSIAEMSISSKQMDEPAVRLLKQGMAADYVIKTTVDREGEGFQFKYDIFASGGRVISGDIHVANIEMSLPALVSRVTELLSPLAQPRLGALGHTKVGNDALQDVAKGVQALRTKGAPLAKHYFQAALIHAPHYSTAKAYLAQTQALLGEWSEAKASYQEVLSGNQLQGQAALKSQVLNGLGNLLRQQGEFEPAREILTQALALTDTTPLKFHRADILRSLSRVSASLGLTQQRHELLLEADTLSRPFRSIELEADGLYYLGSASNTGLEVDPNIDMLHNQKRLSLALEYYRGLERLPAVARTLLAIGQNYLFDLNVREQALKDAQALFIQLQDPSSLIDTLAYQGFFYVQLHQGQLALPPLDEALSLIKKVPDPMQKMNLLLVLGLANLDLGIDQGEGAKPEYLRQAVAIYRQLLAQQNQLCEQPLVAAASFLMSWGLSELGEYDQALSLMNFSKACYLDKGMEVSLRYAQTSIMDIYLLQKRWQNVLEVAEQAMPHYLVLLYKARALYELGRADEALMLSEQNKLKNASKWTPQDEQTLNQYRQGVQSSLLGKHRSSHLVYCESDWNMDGLDMLVE